MLSFILIFTIATVLFTTHRCYADYPVFYQRYTADPCGLEYNGRLYLYCSHDIDGQISYKINDITCISTDDLKNWTDHGEVFNATTNTSWATYAWAPAVVYRNNKFYMYYGNNAWGIGVAVSDSPTGPKISDYYYVLQQYGKFTDPGYKRVAAASDSTDIKTCAFVSPDNNKLTIILINKGSSESIVSLNLNGYSSNNSVIYCTVPGGTDKFSLAGSLTNNTVTLPAQSIVTVALGVTGTDSPPTLPDSSKPTSRSAFSQIEAESYNSMYGVQTELIDDNGNRTVGYIENGDYVCYSGVDFGTGATGFQARVASATGGGNIEIRLDGANNTTIAKIPVNGTGSWGTWADISQAVSGLTGKHDLYLFFSGSSGYLFNIDNFKFTGSSGTIAVGDLNGDGKVDTLDYNLMKEYLLGTITSLPVGNDMSIIDINGDGSINSLDLAALKKKLLGK